MANSLYFGINGSGKSYEVISAVILPALASGRRVVTNIDGLDSEKIGVYLLGQGLLDDANRLGEIFIVTKLQILRSDFFPYYNMEGQVVNNGIVRPGDLVVVDEAFNVWGVENKIHPNHLSFFREHRHFTDSVTKVSCDLVVITQSIGDIHKLLKSVLQESFSCHKAKAVGLNNTYTVTVYAGSRITKRTVLNDFTRQFNPEIFPLYKSYDGGIGKEATVDSKAVLTSDKRLIFKIIALICIVAWSVYYFGFKFFKAENYSNTETVSAKDAASQLPANINPVQIFRQRRIIGQYHVDGFDFVILADQNGQTEIIPASNLLGSGLSLTVIEGQQSISRNSAPVPRKDDKKGLL